MNNPLQMLGMMRNPQMFMQQMMNNNQIMQNPIAKNTIEMMQKKDYEGLEQTCRNLYQQMGYNPDEIYNHVKNQLGIK